MRCSAIVGLGRPRGRSHEKKFPMVSPNTLGGATRVDGEKKIRKEEGEVVDERLNSGEYMASVPPS